MLIELKQKNGYERGIVLEPLIPINYIKCDAELKIYHFALFPTFVYQRDRCMDDERSVTIKWLMGEVEFYKRKISNSINVRKS